MPPKQPIVKFFYTSFAFTLALLVTTPAEADGAWNATIVKMMATARIALIILFFGIYPLMSRVVLYESIKIKTIQQKWCYPSLLLNHYYFTIIILTSFLWGGDFSSPSRNPIN